MVDETRLERRGVGREEGLEQRVEEFQENLSELNLEKFSDI